MPTALATTETSGPIGERTGPLTVLAPVPHDPSPGGGRLAPRATTLTGQVLGIMANGLGNSIVLFEALLDELQRLDDYADTVVMVKDSVSVPPTPDQWTAFTNRVTVAVTGFGGCGSCSARAMRDALELEWHGIPAAYVGHEALETSAGAISRISGHPEHPQVLAAPRPPVGPWPEDECRLLAAQLAPQVRSRLISAPPAER